MIRINLLPHKKVKPVEKSVQRIWMLVVALSVLGLLGMAATYFMQSGKAGELQEKLDDASARLATLKGKVKEVEGYENSRKEYENKITIIGDLQKKRAFLTPFVSEINKAMIKSVWINSISETDGAFTIQASCKENRNFASEFGDNLKKSPALLEVAVNDLKEVPSGSTGVAAFSFQVTGKIAGVEGLPQAEIPKAAPVKDDGKNKKK